MINRILRLVRRLLLGLLILAPTAVFAEAIHLAGSTTVYPLAQDMAAAYAAGSPGTEIAVAAGGSGIGLRALIEGKADIATSSRYLNDKELRLAAEQGIHLVPFRIAYDCIIPVVNRSNPVKDLSVSQLRDIYTGKVTNWKTLGGDDLAINAIARKATSGTFQVWNSKILGEQSLGQHVTQVASNSDVVAAVSANRNAIGYIALGYLNAYVKPLSLEGTMGSSKLALNGQYPLSRPLFLFTRGWPAEGVLDFINFATDPGKGQKIVDKSGFVPLY